jgi:hypothetical protein
MGVFEAVASRYSCRAFCRHRSPKKSPAKLLSESGTRFISLSIFRRAARPAFYPRKSSRTRTMGGHRWLSLNCCSAGARDRFAYLSAAGVGLFPSHSACFFEPSRQFDDLFGYGRRLRRCGRPDQFLALPARTARQFCDVRRLRKLAETGFYASTFRWRSPARL